jgi:glycosyltransferase involved in cell wall biosynthesis
MSATADIVAFAEDWGRHPTSSQHLLRHLAADRRILYINSIGLRRPRFDLHDAARATRKLLEAFKRRGTTSAPCASCAGQAQHGIEVAAAPPDVTPANMDVYSPLAISWPASKIAFALNRRLLKRQLDREMDARDMRRPILWTSLPSALPVVGTLHERALVYYCCDDFGSLVGVDHKPVMAMERELVERADLVLAASEVLADRLPSEKTFLIPHGTDLDHFARPVERAADLPHGRKVAGFYGSLDARLDYEMLLATAKRLSDWQFVLIGPERTDLSSLRRQPNINILGARAYRDLPRYVQHWQVSMILYNYDAQVHAGNPLKLREYLAAGTPIASISVPSLKPYAPLLSICERPDGFADAIIRAGADTNRNVERRLCVADDGWDARARDIARRLDTLV